MYQQGTSAESAKRPRLLHGVLMVKNDGSMAIRTAKDACDELGVEEHKVSPLSHVEYRDERIEGT